MTPLDQAHANMSTDPEDEAARIAFYFRLADSPLFVLLNKDAGGDALSAQSVDIDGAEFVLAFDREERLADFTGKPADYAEIPGRKLAEMLAGRGMGLGLNLGVAPSEILLPAEAMHWLVEALITPAEETAQRPIAVSAPDIPETLAADFTERLQAASGLLQAAHLASVRYADGRAAPLLALIGVAEAAQPALRQALAEAAVVGGLATGLDIGFFQETDPIIAELKAKGRALPLTAEPAPARPGPGMDPDKPPRLR